MVLMRRVPWFQKPSKWRTHFTELLCSDSLGLGTQVMKKYQIISNCEMRKATTFTATRASFLQHKIGQLFHVAVAVFHGILTVSIHLLPIHHHLAGHGDVLATSTIY